MSARLAFAVLALGLAPAGAPAAQVLFPGLSGAPLRDALDAAFSPAQVLGYDRARDSLYAYEQRTAGRVCGVYSGYCIALTPGADPSTDAFTQGINAEHTWPQSMGAADEPSRSDLHHLFPARDAVNSARGNLPFGEIPDAEADAWYRGTASQSAVPTVFLAEWSERDNDHPNPTFAGRFEPRDDHKGNAARAVFYYRAVYPEQVAAYRSQAFFDVQRRDLLAWNAADPVDLPEYARSAWIATRQGTPNPFVLDSTLARRAFPSDSTGGPVDPPPPPPPSGTAGALWINELHYENDGTDAAEGVELAGPAGTDLGGWSLVLYNGNGGLVYRTVALNGVLPDQQGGVGTVWVPVAGLQNGTPDGIALVAPDGEVAQFLAYEGTFDAADGPAAGVGPALLAVRETATTPLGLSLQLTGTGATAADFAWQPPTAATPGRPNAGQTFEPRLVAVDALPGAAFEATVYPNPARDHATLALALAAPADVRAEVLDVLGRRVAQAEGGWRSAGFQRVALDLRGLPAGLYVVRVTAGLAVRSERLTVVR